jgi:SAM-dependent methyltransferase
MSQTSTPAPDLDPDELKRFSFTVWNYKMGELVSFMIYLGDELDMFSAMQGAGPMTSQSLADSRELNERFVREWLLGMAAARLIDRNNDATFVMSDVAAAVLADEAGSVNFAAGAFRGGTDPAILAKVVDSFRTGLGITYEAQGPGLASGLSRMTAPRSLHELTQVVLPGLDGVVEKLGAGISVCDIGCGGGVALRTMAEAYPNSTFVGYDPSGTAIAQATEAAEAVPNVTFVEARGEDLPADNKFDLILTFDCLHDMPRPDIAATAVRNAIAEGGTWLIKDIKCTGDFDKDRKNPMLAMMYGFSLASCLQSAMSEPDALGLGTVGLHPARAEELVKEAGFSQFIEHDFDDPSNLFYEVRV